MKDWKVPVDEVPVKTGKPVRVYVKGTREGELAEALRVNRLLCSDMKRLLQAYDDKETVIPHKPIEITEAEDEWRDSDIAEFGRITEEYELRAKQLRKKLNAVVMVSHDAPDCRMQFRFVSLVRESK